LPCRFSLAVRARDHRGLDGDRQAAGDRRRTPWGRSTAEDGGGETFLAREEWAQPGSPRLWGGKPRGRKSRRRHCGKAIEACRPVARSRHQEAARVARQTACEEEDVADMGPCKRPGFTGEGTETLANRKAAPAIRDPGSARLQIPGSVGCGFRCGCSKRCGDRVAHGQASPSTAAGHLTEDMTKRDLSCPWSQVPQETRPQIGNIAPPASGGIKRCPTSRTPDDDPAIRRTG
jgi:hypothetical protein